jgi:hypothetical protein
MYGLLNQSVQAYVVSRHGDTMWTRLSEEVCPGDPPFLALDLYPDGVTYGLVAALAAATGEPAEAILTDVGAFFTGYFATRGYDDLMRATGGSFAQFVRNIDLLHAQISIMFPRVQVPSFRVTEESGTSLRLHYYSSRDGLAPMVTGMLQGVAERFGQNLHMRHDVSRSSGADHDEFFLEFSPSGSIACP